jgi:outer membrane protein assembly factor BamA
MPWFAGPRLAHSIPSMQPAWLATLAAAASLTWSSALSASALLPTGSAAWVRMARPVAAPAADTLVGRRRRPEVLSVTIRGAHVVKAGDIKNRIVTTASHCRGVALVPFCLVSKAPYFYQRFYLDRDELKRDVIRIRVLYWLRGYRLASVDTTVSPPGATTARVTFIVHEGPPTRVTSVTVVPDTIFSPRVLRRLVRLRAGDPLDLTKLDSTVTQLRSHLWARGDADAIVDTTVRLTGQPPDDSTSRRAAALGQITAGTGAVTISMTPHARAIIDTVIVTGNTHVSAQTIRHGIVLRPHSVFLRADVERSQRALFQTGLFRSAAIQVDSAPGKPDSVKQVLVNVAEGPHREATGGVGFTTADFVSLSSHFTDHNWVGGGRELILTGGLGNLFAHGLYSSFNNGYKEIPPEITPDEYNQYLSPTWTLAADVTQPWFLGPENTLGLGVFAHRRIAPGVFIDNGEGGNVSFTHNLAQRMPLSLTYRYEVTHVDAGDAYFCVDYGVCDPATREALRTRDRLSPLTAGVTIDRSNDPLNPTAGFVAHGEVQYASQFTASDYRYERIFLWGSMYRPVGRAVLAFNGRTGIVAALGHGAANDTIGTALHPTALFYAGGSQSVRGFAENELGPRQLTIAPNVLRGPNNQCPLSTPIQQCPVNAPYLSDTAFTPQPTGGRTLLEGSVELRFPIYQQFGGAIFVDGAVVGEGILPSLTSLNSLARLTSLTSGISAITPGFGFRYYSLIGPIRVDIGVNPLTTYRLPVLTETSSGSVVVVTGPPGTSATESQRVYAPERTLGGLQGLLNRFSLNLALGQAF